MEGCFTFQWGICFLDGGGFIFNWGVRPMGGGVSPRGELRKTFLMLEL